jgi:uncharacterized protein (TIGR03083 family)
MSERGIAALRAESHEVLKLARTLTDEEWAAPSDCEGWRVQDVVAHMANAFRLAVDPGSLPEQVPGDIEATQAVHAAKHREWSPAEVLADYEDMASRGIEMFAGFQDPGLAEAEFPLDNGGKYKLHLLPDLFTFDHFCHLRNDMLQPVGPVERDIAPPDDLRAGVVVGFMLTGVPQMSGAALTEAATAPVGLRFTGPGGGEWTINPAAGDDGGLVTVAEGLADDVQATATSSALDFVLWGSWRRPWAEVVQVDGDADLAAGVLSAIHVF